MQNLAIQESFADRMFCKVLMEKTLVHNVNCLNSLAGQSGLELAYPKDYEIANRIVT